MSLAAEPRSGFGARKGDDVVAAILEALWMGVGGQQLGVLRLGGGFGQHHPLHPHGRIRQRPLGLRSIHAQRADERGGVPLSPPQRHQRTQDVVDVGHDARPVGARAHRRGQGADPSPSRFRVRVRCSAGHVR